MKNLDQPEFVHVLLNHLPLTGLFVALLALGGALLVRRRAAVFLGLGLVALFALSAWPTYEYGEAGFDRVLSMSDDEGQAYLRVHQQLAERWILLFYVTAAAAVAAMIVGWKWPRLVNWAALAVLLLALSSVIVAGVIADYGGKVRHREFRVGPPPAVPEEQGS